MNNKVVYIHKDQEGAVRYVGSGTLHRAKDWGKRNKQWHLLFDEVKPVVEIVHENLTEKECEKIEKELILKHKDTVCNKILTTRRKIPLDFETLNKVFYVDETSPSCLRWKVNNRLHPNQPNFRDTGDIAGKITSSENGRGQGWSVKYDYTALAVNRIVYLLTHGSISIDSVIRHKNGDSFDNTPNNLIETTQSEVVKNTKNRPLPATGIRGILEVYKNDILVGYKTVVRDITGKRKVQQFTSKKLSLEEKLQLAKESYILIWESFYGNN